MPRGLITTTFIFFVSLNLACEASESHALKKPCDAFAKTADKVLETSKDTAYFKTHVLTEAALSQARSYPGSASSGEIFECVPRHHEALWSKILVSGRHFKFNDAKLKLLRDAVLSQIRRETAAALSLEGLLARIDLIHRLVEFNYTPDIKLAELTALQEQVRKIKTAPASSSKAQARLLSELRAVEKARLKLRGLLDQLPY